MTKRSVPQAALEWLANGEVGASSQTLCLTMMGTPSKRPDHPYDDSDLGRCLKLLDAVPEWKPRLPEMAAVSPRWADLVNEWDELEAMYRAGDLKECGRRVWAIATKRHPGDGIRCVITADTQF